MTKKRILFVGEGVTLSHIIRPLFLAQSLKDEDYDVFFACDERYRPLVNDAGVRWENLSSMSTDEFKKRLTNGERLYNYDRLNQYLCAERELLDKIKPDLIVGDFRISLSISSQLAQIPYACLINAYWSSFSVLKKIPLPELPITKILGFIFAQILFRVLLPVTFYFHCKDFNRICRENGFPPLKTIRQMYSQGTWTLYPDIPQIFPCENLPKNHHYLGPICELPHMPQPPWWGTWPKDKPLIYLSLGSSGNIDVLTSIKDVLKNRDVSVIFATSGRDTADRLPKNFFVTDYVSGFEAAKVCHLFITNGGSGSVYQGLSGGVPILGFPTNMDQFFMMEQIEHLGAGKLIRPSFAKTNNIDEAITSLLTTKAYRESALNLSVYFQQTQTDKIFKDFLKEIFKNT